MLHQVTQLPSERVLEILFELNANKKLQSGVKRICLKYNHHKRELEKKVLMMTSSSIKFNEMSTFSREYGNAEVE